MMRVAALITGSTSGIGQALATALSKEFDLILHGRDAAKLAETRTRCDAPARHTEWIADLRDPQGAAASLIELLTSRDMAIAQFVHCAGVTRVEPLRLSDPVAVAEMFAVNVLSAIAIVRALVADERTRPALRSVLLISSAAAIRGENGVAIYSATKGALDGLTRALAVELAPSVRVNALLPGLIRTPMSEATLANSGSPLEKYPLGIGDPADAVAAARIMLSESARWVTGAEWIVDGGRTLF